MSLDVRPQHQERAACVLLKKRIIFLTKVPPGGSLLPMHVAFSPSQEQQQCESSLITNHQSQNQPTLTFCREVTSHGHTACTLQNIHFWSLPPWQRQPIKMTLSNDVTAPTRDMPNKSHLCTPLTQWELRKWTGVKAKRINSRDAK